jgi:hypothetical protein
MKATAKSIKRAKSSELNQFMISDNSGENRLPCIRIKVKDISKKV